MWPFREMDLTPDWNKDLPDPPYRLADDQRTEKAIAVAKPPPVTGPQVSHEISLDGQPSVRLHTRGQP